MSLDGAYPKSTVWYEVTIVCKWTGGPKWSILNRGIYCWVYHQPHIQSSLGWKRIRFPHLFIQLDFLQGAWITNPTMIPFKWSFIFFLIVPFSGFNLFVNFREIISFDGPFLGANIKHCVSLLNKYLNLLPCLDIPLQIFFFCLACLISWHCRPQKEVWCYICEIHYHVFLRAPFLHD